MRKNSPRLDHSATDPLSILVSIQRICRHLLSENIGAACNAPKLRLAIKHSENNAGIRGIVSSKPTLQEWTQITHQGAPGFFGTGR